MKTTIAFGAAALAVATMASGAATPNKPHVCNGPAKWAAEGRGDAITLAFTITPEGDVADARVLDSSGYADMDARAVACAREWHYNRDSTNGVPAAVPWRMVIFMGDSIVAMGKRRYPGPFADDIKACVVASSLIDTSPGAYEITDIRFRFSAEGVATASVEYSTASAALNRKIEECARTLPPRDHTGVPNSTFVFPVNWATELRSRATSSGK